MSTTLAIEASSSIGSVAIVRDGEILNEVSFECPRGRGGELFAALESVLAEAPKIHRVVVGIGPGSYNGIRSAIAVAWGIATARNIPLVGVPSLLGLAGSEYFAVGDARGGHFYFSHVRDGGFVVFPEAVDEECVMSRIGGVSSAPVYVPAPVTILSHGTVAHPVASRLAERSAGFAPSESIPEPLYLKPPKITEPRERKSYLK
jgi:tRNA threonylcarbamoyladenosine biosynthesis protein TsaB